LLSVSASSEKSIAKGIAKFLPLMAVLQGKGPAAIAVRDMCIRMGREAAFLGVGSGQMSPAPLMSRAILIDREVDLVTPMMTQVQFMLKFCALIH
jgi:hypothetical protein